MDDKSVEICGKSFDLADPEQKKAAIRAWLKARVKESSQSTIPDDNRNPLTQTPAACGAPKPPEAQT